MENVSTISDGATWKSCRQRPADTYHYSNGYSDDDRFSRASHDNTDDDQLDGTCQTPAPPLPPRQQLHSSSSSSSRSLRRVPASPVPPPPIPPRERASPLPSRSDDDADGDAWTHQRLQQQLNRRPPPPPCSSSPRMIADRSTVQLSLPSSPAGSWQSTEAPELIPRCRVQQQSSPDSRASVSMSSTSPALGVVFDVEGLVYNTGHLCRTCCDSVIAASAGGELMIMTAKWRSPMPTMDRIQGFDSPNSDQHAVSSSSRGFLAATVVTTTSSLSCSRTLSPTSRLSGHRDSPSTTRAEPLSVGSGPAAESGGVCRRRRTNEYVDTPSSLSSSSPTSSKHATSTNVDVDSDSPRRLLLFVSTPCSTRNSSSSSATPPTAGSRRTLATISPTTSADLVERPRGPLTPSSSSSPSRLLDVVETTPIGDDKATGVARRFCRDDENLSCSFCCGGGSSIDGSSDDQRVSTGCRSLVAALCLPGLWLVRRAKASYRRRVRRRSHHVSPGRSDVNETAITGEKRLVGDDIIAPSASIT